MLKQLSFLLLIAVLLYSCSTITPSLVTFQSDKNEIQKGEKVVITWSVSDAKSVSITGIGTNLDISGKQEITVNETAAFTLTAKNGDKELIRSLTINVSQPVVTEKKVEKVEEKPQPKSTPIKDLSQFSTG